MRIFAFFLLGLVCGLVAFSFLASSFSWLWQQTHPEYPEVAEVIELAENEVTFDDFSDFFKNIAREKGGAYAYELMKRAPLPFGLDTHLLGHVVGDVLYEQAGTDGMAYCTHDFRNACSHTIAIGTFLEYGTEAVDKIQAACKAAPGGLGAYTMCYHGLGHGVLAFNEYSLEETAELCRTMGTIEHNYEEAHQCFGGAIMEIVSGGGHDTEQWELKRTEYLSTTEPLAVCNASYLTEGERIYCYTYITPFVLESVGADIGRPKASDFQAVFKICDEISEQDSLMRQTCFEGMGKEFIGVVGGRDFRNGISITPDGYKQLHQMCNLAQVEDGVRACERSVVGSLFWGGENPVDIPLAFCARSRSNTTRDNCYEALVHNITLYVPDSSERQVLCEMLPLDVQRSCIVFERS